MISLSDGCLSMAWNSAGKQGSPDMKGGFLSSGALIRIGIVLAVLAVLSVTRAGAEPVTHQFTGQITSFGGRPKGTRSGGSSAATQADR